MVLLRKIFFYIFLAIYVVLCPLTILYALGIIYSPGAGEGGGIVKTGLISLSTVPSNATVYIGESRFAKKTPTIIRNLVPGNYLVNISLAGYKTWTQAIPVEEEKASTLDHILLLPLEMEKRILMAAPFQDIIPVPGTQSLIVKKEGSRFSDYFVYDLNDERHRPLATKDIANGSENVRSIFTVDRSEHAFLISDMAGIAKYYWVSLTGKEPKMQDVTNLVSGQVSHVYWDKDDESTLFINQNGNVKQLRLEDLSVSPFLSADVKGFGVFDDRAYFVDAANDFKRADYNGKEIETLFSDPNLGAALFGGDVFFDVQILPHKLILFRGSDGRFLANRLPYQFAGKDVLGVLPYKNSGKILIWSQQEVGLINFEKKNNQDAYFEKGPKLDWVWEQGVNIQQVFWIYEDSHVLVRDGQQVVLLDLETFGKIDVRALLEVKPSTSIFYSEETGQLYYLDAQDGNLCSMEIYTPRELIPLPTLPEWKENTTKPGVEET